MVYLVNECFHSVGNGTLFSGQILGSRITEDFKWIYDCGSTSKKTIDDTVTNLPLWFQFSAQFPITIDMLVISHFDDDHVNGIELLLKKFYVKQLVIPYSEWAQNIREISVLGKRGVTPSVALFQLNPAKWLQVNGLENRISEILLVKGGRELNDDRSGPIESSLDLSELPEDFLSDADSVESIFFQFDSPIQRSGIKLMEMNHFQSITGLNNSFEFMFYNAEKNFSELGLIYEVGGQSFAKKSKALLSKAKADIEQTIISLGLHQNIKSLPYDWRKKLKRCYEKHFGSTGKAKNNISLCVYAAPLKAHKYPYGLGTLLTGDINLSRNVIDDMKMHFGIKRWQSLEVVQIPHHGSQHSWTVGNTAEFTQVKFIQCVTPTKNHPHAKVKADLANYGAIVDEATRKKPVDYSYLF